MRLANVLPAPSALLKLFARWMTLSVIYLLALAVMLPLLFLEDTGFRVFTGQTMSSDFNTSVARQLVLHLGVTVPLILALQASAAAGEMLGTPMAWSLPSVRRKILSGHVMIVLLITAIVGVFASRRVDSHTTLIAMCMVPFWYAVGAGWGTLYLWPRVGLPLMLFTLIAALKPVWYVTAVSMAPFNIIVVGMALSFGVVSLLSQGGAPWGRAVVAATTAKARAVQFDSAGLGAFVGSYFAPFLRASVGSVLAPFRIRDRNVSTYHYGGTRHSLAQWINAAFIESARSARQSMYFRLLLPALLAVFVYASSVQIGIIAILIVLSSLQLSDVLPYPLSRRKRAHIKFACSLLETLLTGGVVWLVFTLLAANGVPRAFASEIDVLPNLRHWQIDLVALMALMPLAQWPPALGPLPANPLAIWRVIIPMSLLMVSVVVIPRLLDRLLGHPPLSTNLLALAATGVVVQVLYYLALRYVYARRDLWRNYE